MPKRPFFLIFFILFFHPLESQAGSPPRVTVPRVVESLRIDGVLDEPEWTTAVDLGEIRQREPKPEVPATEPTEVRLLRDRDTLYIGVTNFDSRPDKVVGTQMGRDASLNADDRIEIVLDTFHDRRNAFYFATNPAGALVDGLVIENNRAINRDWNAIWNVRVKRTDRGWTAEFAIPFKSLSFVPGDDTWGFNISRTIVRKLEEDRWAAPRLDIRFTQVSEAGEIAGMSEAVQGLGLDVRPYAVGRWIKDGPGADRFEGDVGGDIFYNITSSLRLTATVNTDFAETEVDDRQINLTRFPLFFPEKRAFFLENVGVFNVGRSFNANELIPFFSRRIGLLGGREVPILGGARLTGKVGKYDVGAIAVRTRATGFTDAKNYFVARVKRNLFTQSYVGAVYTEGNPASRASNRLVGVDLRLATANFLGTNRNATLDAYALKSSTSGPGGDGKALGVFATYPNDRWDGYAEWKRVEANFNPALGFVQRRATDKLFLGGVYKPRPKNFLNIRQAFNEVFFTMYRRNDLTGATPRTESWRLFTAPINWEFNSGDRFEANWVAQFERLFVPFQIAPNVTLPAGDYRFTRYRVEFDTAGKRPWEIGATWWFGTYYSGRADELNVRLTYKLAPRFRIAARAQQTFARLPQGNFVARVYTVRADYAFSPFLTVSNFVQFDNDSRNLGWQSRLRWILKPGNDVFLVFNQGWTQDARGGFNFARAATNLTAKFQYTLRF